MKKILLTILTVVYMTVSSGIAMEIHYCMGKRAGIEYFKTGGEKCGKCGMKEKRSGCCHDEHKFHKLEDSHKNVYNNISFHKNEITLISTYAFLSTYFNDEPLPGKININSPPEYTGPSDCIMNCVFRL
ncbi:MAG: hypothetical protein ABIO04_08700 [Ferruginibacter sp.]